MTKINYKSNMKAIPFQEFLKRTGFSLDNFGFQALKEISYIVAPTDLKKILMICIMPMPYLEGLLAKIGTLDDANNKVYANADISLGCIDPNLLLLGQKFIYRKNYTAILENFHNLFPNFAMSRGTSKLTPYIIIGKDAEGRYVIAHYLPPIIEVHGDKLILLDGVHRSFIAKQCGDSPQTIIIRGVETPFPCTPRPWDEIQIINEKPENIEDRYFDLNVGLFRDLKAIGIDG